jgi:hypothetical protein
MKILRLAHYLTFFLIIRFDTIKLVFQVKSIATSKYFVSNNLSGTLNAFFLQEELDYLFLV